MTEGRKTEWQQKYGPVALVTGASDGIGREMARELAAKGIDLILVARRRDRLDRLAEELRATHQVDVAVRAGDLGDPDFINGLIFDLHDMPIGLLAACAGFGTSGLLQDTDLVREMNMIDVNCRSVLALTKVFAEKFAEQKRGGIILFSAIHALQGVAYSANFAATKAYVQTLGEGLAAELAPVGVDVIVSAPGRVYSGFAQRSNIRFETADSPKLVAVETLAALGKRRIVRPGMRTKLLSYSLSILPRRLRSFMMGRIMAGMTKHQYESYVAPR